MGLKQFQNGDKVHSMYDPLKEYEVILKGTVLMTVGSSAKIELQPGSIIGPLEEESGKYCCDFLVKGEAVLYGYPAGQKDMVENIVSSNVKIAPQMASAAVKNATSVKEAASFLSEYAKRKKEDIEKRFDDYVTLCKNQKKKPKSFPEITELPDPPDISVEGWKTGFLETFVENDEMFRKQVYTLSSAMCTGIVMTAVSYAKSIMSCCNDLNGYINDIDEASTDFLLAFDEIDTAVKNEEHAKAQSRAMTKGAMPDLTHAAESIAVFAGLDAGKREELFTLWNEYLAVPDRSDSSDDMRKLRRKLTQWFYKLYDAVFFKSLNKDELPIEVKMFLYTGFFDPKVAGENNTSLLFNYMVDYDPDPEEEVFSLYEWLKRIHEGLNEPSRNEFDMDYPASLRERKVNGEITEEMYEKFLNDPVEKTRFEMKNLFELGNRMTFGRVSMFFPFFDSVNVLMPLEKIYVTPERIREELKNIRALDYQCFFREDVYQNPEAGIPQMVVHNEYLPYFIMMPNCGGRSVLWQEIEGKKRSTHSRMLMPLFNLEDLSDAVTEVCGEFRWEMCKTEQGVHWNDLSDPSLTAEYSDYLQYFRKNSALNPEQREKIKKVLQKAGNNYRRVFTADYLTYIKFEAKGALRLNKVAREILFAYCPFGAAVREEIGANPQYQPLITRMKNKVNQKARPILNIKHKIEGKGDPVPKEVENELNFYRM